MKKNEKKNIDQGFIEQQVDSLKKEINKLNKEVAQDKNTFANNLSEGDILSGIEADSNYFENALKKIDTDRITVQMEITKIDSEIEKEEVNKELKQNEKVEEPKKLEQFDSSKQPIKEEKKKMTFLDKLLQIL